MYGNSVTERIQTFHRMHGNCIISKGWVYFEDGAVRENNPYGPLIEPSNDPHERAKKVLFYYKLKLQEAVCEFDNHKTALRIQANAGAQSNPAPPPPSQEALDHLKELRDQVKKLKDSVEKAEWDVENTLPEDLKRRRSESAKNRQDNQNFVSLLNEISI